MRRKLLIVVVSALIGLGLAVNWKEIGGKRVVHHPDGGDVALLGVVYGQTNQLFPGGLVDRLINHFVPAKGIKIGSIQLEPVVPLVADARNLHGQEAYTNNLLVWIEEKSPTNNSVMGNSAWGGMWQVIRPARASLTDEDGIEWFGDRELYSGGYRKGNLDEVTPWSFPLFPHRGNKLRFRLYEKDKDRKWETRADFRILNPLAGRYPVWDGSPLPNVQRDGELEVSLLDLVTKWDYALPTSWVASAGPVRVTEATFKVRGSGQATIGWLPDEVEARDATGNETHPSTIDVHEANGLVYFQMSEASLSPSETWRVRTRFFGREKFIWKSPDIPLSSGFFVTTKLATNVESFPITIECHRTGYINMVSLDVGNLRGAFKATADIIDDEGNLCQKGGSFRDSGFDAECIIPRGVKSVNVVVSLSPLRTFEFAARPRADTNGVAGE